jgi:hypothetical protein
MRSSPAQCENPEMLQRHLALVEADLEQAHKEHGAVDGTLA